MNSAIKLMILIFMTAVCGCSSSSSDSQDKKNDLGTGLDGGADTDVDTDTDTDLDAGSDADSGVTCEYGWRKVFETPEQLNSVWGTAMDNVYAVGVKGYIFHFDGIEWSEMQHPDVSELWDVWGLNENYIFAVGKGSILHCDGIHWSLINCPDIPELYGVWGSDGSDIYFVGGEGGQTGKSMAIIYKYSNETCSRIFSEEGVSLVDLWGSSSNDIYASGGGITKGARLLHFDGSDWSRYDTGIESTLYMWIWGSSTSDIFISSENIDYEWEVIHFDGIKWSTVEIEIPHGTQFSDISGSAEDNVYMIGNVYDSSNVVNNIIMRYDGEYWVRMDSESSWALTGIWTGSEDKAFAVGYDVNSEDGIILQYSCE